MEFTIIMSVVCSSRTQRELCLRMMDQNERPICLEDVGEGGRSFWCDTEGFELPDECREVGDVQFDAIFDEPFLQTPEDYLDQALVWSRYCEKMEIRFIGTEATDVYEVIDGGGRRLRVILSDEASDPQYL